MEALGHLLSNAVHRGLLTGFEVGMAQNTSIVVSHLFYADDVSFFVERRMARLDI